VHYVFGFGSWGDLLLRFLSDPGAGRGGNRSVLVGKVGKLGVGGVAIVGNREGGATGTHTTRPTINNYCSHIHNSNFNLFVLRFHSPNLTILITDVQ
jgi:hypothetical protein